MSSRSGQPVIRLLQPADAGDRTALHHAGESLSFDDLDVRARRLETGLRGLGVGPGDRVAVWLPNIPPWLDVFFACSRIGAIVVSVNTRFRSTEVEDIVGRSGARVLVVWPAFRGIDFLGILDDIASENLPALEAVVLYSEGEERGADATRQVLGCPVTHYEQLLASDTAPPSVDDQAVAGSGCVIFTTSGTTKAPKFVLHGQQGLVQHAHEVADAFGYRAADARFAEALPFCGVFGFCQILASLAAERPSFLLPSFSAAEVVDLVAREHITHMHATDDMWQAMFDVAPPGALATLRACGFAAFTGSPAELVAAGDRHGVRLVGLYGMSEVQALFAARAHDTPAQERQLAGGALTSPTAAVRVRDPASGQLLGTGAQGELEVRGPSVMLGYYENPEANAETFTDDGYVRTGDLGTLREDGTFEYLARMGDVLRLGGFLVSPAEIEARLESHPFAQTAQVVGLDIDGRPGCVAFVIPAVDIPMQRAAEATSSAPHEAELSEHCATALAKYKVPGRVFFLSAFPTTASANGTKVQKAQLRRMAEELL